MKSPLSPRHSLSCRHKQPGFTLVETLLAITVLTIMLFMLTSVIGSISTTWKAGVARVDNFSQVRGVLGVIDRDIQAMVLRRDLAEFPDDACAFYTRFQAPSASGSSAVPARALSAVQYKLNTIDGAPELDRCDFDFDFSSGSHAIAFGTASTTLSALNSLTPQNSATSQKLVDGVIGFQIQFLTASGTYQSSYKFDYDKPTDSDNTRAIIVSLLVLDDAAYQLAKKTGAFVNLINDLNTAIPAGQSYAQYWNSKIYSTSFGTGYPKPIRNGLRAFERRISLPMVITQ